MARTLWAAQLPADLSDAIASRRFLLESDSELCNRLILDLIDWIQKSPAQAVEQAPLKINLARVSHPENVENYLRAVINHEDGYPLTQIDIPQSDWRAAIIANTRLIVSGVRLPKNRELWQLRAVEAVDRFIDGLNMAASKSERVEAALRWAVQLPATEEWTEPSELLAWLNSQYGMNIVAIADCLAAAPRRASRRQLIEYLDRLEQDFSIDLTYANKSHPWVTIGGNGVRSLQVAPPREYIQVNAYRVRDAISKRPTNLEYSRLIRQVVERDRWLQVKWRATTLGFLVGDAVGAQICPEPTEIDLRTMSQPEFFKEFSGAVKKMRESTIDGIRMISDSGDAVVLFSASPATK